MPSGGFGQSGSPESVSELGFLRLINPKIAGEHTTCDWTAGGDRVSEVVPLG